MSNLEIYNKAQKIIATIFYFSLVAALILTIVGTVYTIADLIMREGKMELFQGLNLGFQIAIVGGLFAGLLFLIVVFYGFSRKGVKSLLKIIYKERLLHDKFKNRILAQTLTVGLLLCIFAIIIGLIIAIFYEMMIGVSFTFLKEFSQGQILLFIGVVILIIIGLIFSLNYLWHNGYYLIVKLIFNLEEIDKDSI